MKEEKITSNPRVGDFIITNEKFFVKSKRKTLVSHPGLYGIIVQKIKDKGITKYGVRFGDELFWANDLNGLLSRPSGLYLDNSEFDLNNDNF